MFVCKVCGSEVRQGQAVCLGCGADVVENHQSVCPVCNSTNAAGSRYCAKCGSILPIMRKPICIVCGVKNMPGAKYCISCGAPIAINSETHSDKEMIAARNIKQRLDDMVCDRMAAVDKEIAERRQKAEEEIEAKKNDLKNIEAKRAEEYAYKLDTLEEYRKKLNELGAEDLEMLKKLSVALKDYSRYYADPYSEIDEDDLDSDIYICPACGTVNPLNCTCCANCGRNKARALLLLAKDKIKQSPPVKRKVRIVAPPQEDLKRNKVPTLDEFTKSREKSGQSDEAKPIKETAEAARQDMPQDFAGRSGYYGGYPYPSYRYPYAQYPQGGFYPDDPNRQMPPIVQPVAFVPYVTQDQPLVQYTPQGVPFDASSAAPQYAETYVANSEQRPQRSKKKKKE